MISWMGEGDAPDGKILTAKQKRAMLRLAQHLDSIAQYIVEPIDPKVEAFLRIASDCLREQIILNKYYPYQPQEPNSNSGDFLFLKNEDQTEDLPSDDELWSWFNAGENNDTGDSE